MFSIANLYNSACSNAVNPIKIHPIMMSIILHHYKLLKERKLKDDYDNDNDDDINDYNNINSTVLKQELDIWYNFSLVLRKKNRILLRNVTIIIQIFKSDRSKRKRKFYRILVDVINI